LVFVILQKDAIMELECGRITRFILPAVRASVAQEMNEKYEYNQQEIANALGVAQVAVSKYLNGKYSGKVAGIKKYIATNRLDSQILRYVRESNAQKTNAAINELCAEIATKKL
jgi:predicted transcriptional regulator